MPRPATKAAPAARIAFYRQALCDGRITGQEFQAFCEALDVISTDDAKAEAAFSALASLISSFAQHDSHVWDHRVHASRVTAPCVIPGLVISLPAIGARQ